MAKKTFTIHGSSSDFHKMVLWCQKNISTVDLTSYIEASETPDPYKPTDKRYLYSSVFSAKGWKVASIPGDTFVVTLDDPDHIVLALLTYHTYEWIEDV